VSPWQVELPLSKVQAQTDHPRQDSRMNEELEVLKLVTQRLSDIQVLRSTVLVLRLPFLQIPVFALRSIGAGREAMTQIHGIWLEVARS